MMRDLETLAIAAVLLVAAFVLANTNAFAGVKTGATLVDQGIMDGRSYHQNFYKNDNCKVCHGTDTPSFRPADHVCLKCHQVDKLAKITTRKDEEEKWQNPHNNLHYGKEVPCAVCHAEHETKQPLCNDCHTFAFVKYKK